MRSKWSFLYCYYSEVAMAYNLHDHSVTSDLALAGFICHTKHAFLKTTCFAPANSIFLIMRAAAARSEACVVKTLMWMQRKVTSCMSSGSDYYTQMTNLHGCSDLRTV